MYFIKPTVITDAMLFGTTVPEADYSEWSASTTYATGDKCIFTTGGLHKIYESLKADNLNNSPPTNYATSTDDTTKHWVDLGATNRWKVFDTKVGSNTSMAGGFTYVLQPGSIDSLAYIGVQGSTARVVVSDPYSDLLDNGSAWTGATGTTPPTSWSLVGDPSDFNITTGEIKITADAPSEGISQTVTVVPGTKMQLLGKYRNTSGDIAQYAISDATIGDSFITISGDGLVTIASGDSLSQVSVGTEILSPTDLTSSTTESIFSYVFTVPAGVTSIKVSLMAKNSGDIVWFDDVSLSTAIFDSPTVLPMRIVKTWAEYYSEPIVEGSRNVVVTDIPRFPSCVVTVAVSSFTTAYLGALVVGIKKEIGTMKYSPSVGINDYSVKAVDEWGNYSITERAWSQRLECDVIVLNTKLDEVYRLLAESRATLAVWVGYEDFNVFILYGKYNSFNIIVPYLTYSMCALQLEGLT